MKTKNDTARRPDSRIPNYYNFQYLKRSEEIVQPIELILFISMFCSSWELLPCNAKVANAMTALYNRELTTTSGGNVSVKDADGSVWMTPTVLNKF